RQAKTFVINDDHVSRDHVLVEELSQGRVRIENLSRRMKIEVGAVSISPSESRECLLPCHLKVGFTRIDIDLVCDAPLELESLRTIAPSLADFREGARRGRPLSFLGEAPNPESMTQWLETVIGLERSGAGTPEWYEEIAHSLVDLVSLELGMV